MPLFTLTPPTVPKFQTTLGLYFSINPPILIFSPVKRTRDNTNKDTLENITEIIIDLN